MTAPRAAVFQAGAFRAIELGANDVPRLQAFFDANPDYSLRVGGRAPMADAAHGAGRAAARRLALHEALAPRHGIEMGERVNDVRVMVKALNGEPLSAYLARVPRDRVDAP